MQKVNSLQAKWRNVVFFFTTALLLVAADQLSKLWIRSNLAIGESLFEVGFFHLTYVRNTGAAFGLLQGQSFLLTIIASVGVAALLLYALFFYHKFPLLDNRLGKLALGLVLGGTVGNLIDRVRFGYVTDFIAVSIWPAFNIADSAIVVGVIMLAYSLLCLAIARKH